MLHSVIETPDFLRDAELCGLTPDERGKIVSVTAAFPKPAWIFQGPEAPGKSAFLDGVKAKAVVTG